MGLKFNRWRHFYRSANRALQSCDLSHDMRLGHCHETGRKLFVGGSGSSIILSFQEFSDQQISFYTGWAAAAAAWIWNWVVLRPFQLIWMLPNTWADFNKEPPSLSGVRMFGSEGFSGLDHWWSPTRTLSGCWTSLKAIRSNPSYWRGWSVIWVYLWS